MQLGSSLGQINTIGLVDIFDVKSTIEPWQHGWQHIQRQPSALESITINRDHWRITQQWNHSNRGKEHDANALGLESREQTNGWTDRTHNR